MARIVIVGGSLGGLMAANMLSRAGHEVRVLEKAVNRWMVVAQAAKMARAIWAVTAKEQSLQKDFKSVRPNAAGGDGLMSREPKFINQPTRKG